MLLSQLCRFVDFSKESVALHAIAESATFSIGGYVYGELLGYPPKEYAKISGIVSVVKNILFSFVLINVKKDVSAEGLLKRKLIMVTGDLICMLVIIKKLFDKGFLSKKFAFVNALLQIIIFINNAWIFGKEYKEFQANQEAIPTIDWSQCLRNRDGSVKNPKEVTAGQLGMGGLNALPAQFVCSEVMNDLSNFDLSDLGFD